MGCKNIDNNFAKGKINSDSTNIIPRIMLIPKIGDANKLEIKKVKESVLK